MINTTNVKFCCKVQTAREYVDYNKQHVRVRHALFVNYGLSGSPRHRHESLTEENHFEELECGISANTGALEKFKKRIY